MVIRIQHLGTDVALKREEASAVIGSYGFLHAAEQREEMKQLVLVVGVTSPASTVCSLQWKKDSKPVTQQEPTYRVREP